MAQRQVARIVILTSLALAITSQSGAAVLYVLKSDSTFQEGCFPPCECPVMETVPLSGTFELGPSPVGAAGFYSVDRILWLAHGASSDRVITGSGAYQISPISNQNELTADLSINQNAAEHYDSGSVPPGAVFPEINVTISKHGMYCFDTAMTVIARPTPRLLVDRTDIMWDSGLETVGYDVVRGSLSTLRSTKGDFSRAIDGCLGNDVHADSLAFSNGPATVDSFVLVRAGKSTYDTGASSQVRSRDAGIAASPFTCP